MGSPSPTLPKPRDGEWIMSKNSSSGTQTRRVSKYRIVLLCFIWLVTIVSLYKLITEQLEVFRNRLSATPSINAVQEQNNAPEKQSKRIVVLPATAPNADFCRTVFSLLINGYGTPTIINWGIYTDRMNHYIKITGFKELLDQPGSADDTFVMVDAYDAWAQLPAETFYQQYEQYPVSSGVITGAEKQCAPKPINHPRCTTQPESPLSRNMYGRFTDRLLTRNLLSKYRSSLKRREPRQNIKWSQYETLRPRFINSGTIVGARHHLKQLYNLAHEKMTGYLAGASFDDAGRKGSDQGILALISLEHRQAKKPLPLTPDAHVLLFQVITNSGRDLEQQTVPDILSKVQSIQKSPLTQTLREDMAWKKRKILWNHATKSVSSFVHMPGPRKVKQLDFWWSQMWWMQPSEDEGFDDSGRPMPPARRLLRHLLEHTTESKGYGIRLANGTWYAFAHICSEHADVILQSEED